METRQISSRFNATEGNTLTGTIPYDAPTEIREGGRKFTEVLRAGCFRSSLTGDVICTFNHNPDNLLGRTSSGTLSLIDTPKGLEWSVSLPESAAHIRELVQRGDLSGCSFTFTTRSGGEKWSGSNRELVDLNLFELGPVVMPAYPSSTVGMRSKLSLIKAKLGIMQRK